MKGWVWVEDTQSYLHAHGNSVIWCDYHGNWWRYDGMPKGVKPGWDFFLAKSGPFASANHACYFQPMEKAVGA